LITNIKSIRNKLKQAKSLDNYLLGAAAKATKQAKFVCKF